MSERPSTAAVRAEVLEHLQPVTAAWSVDGRTIRFVTGFEHPLNPGRFVTVTTKDGARYLVQVDGVVAEERGGIVVEADPALLGIGAALTSAQVTLANRVVTGSGRVLARLDGDQPAAFVDADLGPADDADVATYLDGVSGGGLEIGTVQDADVPARLRTAGFARHTFMCGQSGSGKTFSLGVVLERMLLETELPIIVVDPNSDYVNIGRLTDLAAINRFRPTPMTPAEYAALAERYERRARVVVASARDGDVPLRIHLSDLNLAEQALTMRIDAIADPGLFGALLDVTRSFADRTYGVAELARALDRRTDDDSRRLARRLVNLDLESWSVWAAPDETSLADIGRDFRALVLDTGSLAEPRERSVVALALLGRLRRRPERSPISVVIDEAHNVCPPQARTPLDQAVTDLALWIAGEGRKYGIYLLLSTQRPQKLHRNVLSQCDNLLLMRMNSAADLDMLAEVFSHVPAPLIDEAGAHRMGEMLAAGQVAPTPLRLQVGVRWTREGGADLPADWVGPAD